MKRQNVVRKAGEHSQEGNSARTLTLVVQIYKEKASGAVRKGRGLVNQEGFRKSQEWC